MKPHLWLLLNLYRCRRNGRRLSSNSCERQQTRGLPPTKSDAICMIGKPLRLCRLHIIISGGTEARPTRVLPGTVCAQTMKLFLQPLIHARTRFEMIKFHIRNAVKDAAYRAGVAHCTLRPSPQLHILAMNTSYSDLTHFYRKLSAWLWLRRIYFRCNEYLDVLPDQTVHFIENEAISWCCEQKTLRRDRIRQRSCRCRCALCHIGR
mmetsp:Transcript_21393/g.32610  ORF Transcript_21393/g.32610 Transcript_21393/m.32610 type:complete len:207 (-) Transcript_21393:508-1128(-)